MSLVKSIPKGYDPDVGEFSLDPPTTKDSAKVPVDIVEVVEEYKLPEPLSWDAIEESFCIIDFVFPGLTAGGLGMLAAPGGTGKSYMLLSLASSIAMGKPLLDDWPKCEPAKVLVFFAEDPPDIVHNRLRYLLQSDWAGDTEHRTRLKENMVVRSLVGEETILAERPKYETKAYRTMLATKIEEEAMANNARLIIFDPLRQFHTFDENDSGDMTEFLKLLHGIAYRTKAAIVFAHHTNKNSSVQGGGDAQQAARGSSAITDNIRWQGNMVVMQEDEATKYNISQDDRKSYLRLVLSKSNYTSAKGDLWFSRGPGGILYPLALIEVKRAAEDLDLTSAPSKYPPKSTDKKKGPRMTNHQASV